ncbi:hypothetical protein E4H12_13190 [Candidatus Thorarchaeota archaeon]|nr:MAG: hypothetical protein E4H12_13190 [Candidatus Thorarchaeota archaeon]
MFEDESEGNNGELLVRLVNFSRVFIYLAAVWVQATVLIGHMNSIPPRYDIMIVAVPLFLGLWDLVMAIWSVKPSTRFWNIAFIVPLVSIAVAINTIAPLLAMLSLPVVETIMLGLSLLVILVSVIEIYALRKVMSSWIRKIDRNFSVDELRTYDM